MVALTSPELRFNNLVLEGVDRLGKNTLITNIRDKLGFFQEIHCAKPQLLTAYYERALEDANWHPSSPEVKSAALKAYQLDSFVSILRSLTWQSRFILNRSHLGEAVYAKRYRGYDGDYVFDLERELIDRGATFHRSALLVTMITTDFSFISDDGLSLDATKREEEQEDFIRAHHRSLIKHKLLLDVNDHGRFADPRKLAGKVITAMTLS